MILDRMSNAGKAGPAQCPMNLMAFSLSILIYCVNSSYFDKDKI